MTAPSDDRSRRFARVNGTLLIAAGVAVFALVSRLPLREVLAEGDLQGMATAGLGVVIGVVLVRSGWLVRRAGVKRPK